MTASLSDMECHLGSFVLTHYGQISFPRAPDYVASGSQMAYWRHLFLRLHLPLWSRPASVPFTGNPILVHWCSCTCTLPYTAERRDVLENTLPEAQEISQGRGFCTPRPERLPEGEARGQSRGPRGAKSPPEGNLEGPGGYLLPRMSLKSLHVFEKIQKVSPL